jgi:hypothetical protein
LVREKTPVAEQRRKLSERVALELYR